MSNFVLLCFVSSFLRQIHPNKMLVYSCSLNTTLNFSVLDFASHICHPCQLQADSSLCGLAVALQMWAHFTLKSLSVMSPLHFSLWLSCCPEIACAPENYSSFFFFMALVTYKGIFVVFPTVPSRALSPFYAALGDCIQAHGPMHINMPVIYNDRFLDPSFL